MSEVKTIDLEGFARLFGTNVNGFSAELRPLIRQMDFRYRVISGSEKDKVISEVEKNITSGKLSISGERRKGDWERGWSENLDNFTSKSYDLNELVPKYMGKYFKAEQPIRLDKGYVMPLDPRFELNFYTVFRKWLFSKYMGKAEAIYEFGCGTGYNLVILASIFPQKKLYGLDWAGSSVNLVDKVAENHGLNLSGVLFDMFNPDGKLEIPRGSIFFTMNSLEQLGSNFERLVQFCLKNKPLLCVHSEPLYELYDEDNPIDCLAMKYHEKRNYLTGFLPRLKELEIGGKIKIVKTHRIPVGSLYHDGYSLVIWKPAR